MGLKKAQLTELGAGRYRDHNTTSSEDSDIVRRLTRWLRIEMGTVARCWRGHLARMSSRASAPAKRMR
jgi:hypothetical protein